MKTNYIECGDCLNLIKNIPDKSVNLVLADLPYGTTRNKWDSVINLDLLFQEYNRIIKDNGVILLFCDGLFMCDIMNANRKYWRYNLVWDKGRGSDFLNANVKPLKSHEEIAVFYKKKPTFNKQMWYSTPYKKTKNGSLSDNYGTRKEAFSESLDGARNPLTVLKFPKDSTRYHPTQKPIKLLEWLIRTYTNEGDLVVDSTMGSGSTIIAAINTNRKYIGFELERKYFDIANERINTNDFS